MKKTGFKAGARLAVVCVAVLVAGCSGDPNKSDITACILETSGHEKVGKEKVNVVMGIEYGRTFINNIKVNNIIPQDGNRWLAQVNFEVGSKQVGLTKEDAKRTAKMFDWEERNGFIVKTVNADYLLMKGSNGFSCKEI